MHTYIRARMHRCIVQSFVRSSIPSFVHSFVSFIHTHWLIHSFIQRFNHSFRFIPACISYSLHFLTCIPAYWVTYLPTYLPTFVTTLCRYVYVYKNTHAHVQKVCIYIYMYVIREQAVWNRTRPVLDIYMCILYTHAHIHIHIHIHIDI